MDPFWLMVASIAGLCSGIVLSLIEWDMMDTLEEEDDA